MDGAHSVATSSATRALNQQDNLGFACCAALKAKSPGIKWYKQEPACHPIQRVPLLLTATASRCIHRLNTHKKLLKTFWNSIQSRDFWKKKKKLVKKLMAPLNSEGEIFTCYQQPVQWKFEESLTERKCSPLIASSCESFIIWVNWMPNFALSKL